MPYGIILLFSLLLLIPSAGYSAPSVSGASGTFTHGSSITVSGSGFQTKTAAAPELFDAIENISAYSALSDGAAAPVGTGYPWGTNTYFSPDAVKFNNTSGEQRGVSTENYSIASSQGSLGHPTTITNETGTLYFSWWIRTQGTLGTDFKLLRLSDSSDEENRTYTWAPENTYIYIPPGSGGCYNDSYKYLNSLPTADTWMRYEVLIDATNMFFTTWRDGTQTSTYSWASAGCSAVSFDDVWRVGVDGSMSPTFWMDDLYLDTTPQRVEICSGSTWSSRGHCEVQPATSWSDTSATITLNRGSFGATDSAYLYVVDSAGATGMLSSQITFGDEGEPAPTTAVISGAQLIGGSVIH